MKDIVEAASKENFDAFMQAKERKLGDEMYIKFQELGVGSDRFMKMLQSGYESALVDLTANPSGLQEILAIRVLVGMSIGFQYAKALQEQQELKALIK